MDFPKRLYHPDGHSFVCPDQEFLDTLDNGKDFEELPFTGPRVPDKSPKTGPCKACTAYKLQIVELELELEGLRVNSKPMAAPKTGRK